MRALFPVRRLEAHSTYISLSDFDIGYFQTLVELLENGEEALKDLEVEDLFNFVNQARMQELDALAAKLKG